MNKKWIVAGVVLIAITSILIYFSASNGDEVSNTNQVETSVSQPQPEPTPEVPVARVLDYEAFATLVNVVETESTGQATAKYFDDGSYELLAEFQNLAPTTNGDFYEGWLVSQTPFDFFSTGPVEVNSAGEIVNIYASNIDHQTEGFTQYVLTIEPDDGDPAPAKHILEGTLEVVN